MNAQRDRIGIEFISFFNDNPLDIIADAAKLGCKHISLALEPMHTDRIEYPQWSLLNDKSLRRDVLKALQDNDVDIAMGECYMIRPGADFRDTAQPALEAMRELNIPCVNMVSIDKDLARATDQCGVLVEMAAALGMQSTLEFGPFMGVSNLQDALNILKAVNRPNFRLVLDAMHFFRSGSTIADLKQLDPDLIGHIQLCDVPVECKYSHYMEEARYERLAPGAGELPLRDFLAAAPRDLIVGLEIPMLSLAKAGVAPYERLKNAVVATQKLLNELS